MPDLMPTLSYYMMLDPFLRAWLWLMLKVTMLPTLRPSPQAATLLHPLWDRAEEGQVYYPRAPRPTLRGTLGVTHLTGLLVGAAQRLSPLPSRPPSSPARGPPRPCAASQPPQSLVPYGFPCLSLRTWRP